MTGARRSAARRGVTFVEVIAAAALLGILAGVVSFGVGSLMGQQQRQSQRLAAAELANRLVLQYLDDDTSLPSRSLPIAYDGLKYRWSLEEQPVEMTPARADKAAELAERATLGVDRLKVITVRVWLSEESGGSFSPDGGVPGFMISRILDPAHMTRNPDSMDAMIRTPERRDRLMQEMQRMMRNRAPSAPNRPQNEQQPPVAPAPATPAGSGKPARPGGGGGG